MSKITTDSYKNKVAAASFVSLMQGDLKGALQLTTTTQRLLSEGCSARTVIGDLDIIKTILKDLDGQLCIVKGILVSSLQETENAAGVESQRNVE